MFRSCVEVILSLPKRLFQLLQSLGKRRRSIPSNAQQQPLPAVYPVLEQSASSAATQESHQTIHAQKSTIYDAASIDPNEVLEDMPLLSYYSKRNQGEHLKNYHFIFILHFLRDLIALVEAFRRAGMDPKTAHFLYKPYLYPHWEVITRQLEGLGCDVIQLTPGTVKRVVGSVLEESKKDGRKIIVVEDGGYVVPYVHELMPDKCEKFVLGAVEQTRNGINKVKETVSQLRVPLLSVAEAKLKRQYESPMVAAAVLQNILRLRPNEYFQGQTALVVGYGSVGYHIANELKNSLPWRMKTEVYDLDVDLRRKAKEDGHIVDDDIRSLIPDAKLVIGITGRTSIGRDEILLLRHRCILLSSSSDQVEIDLGALRDLSGKPQPLTEPDIGKVGDIYRLTSNKNEILLLAEGYPINFWKTESLPNKLSQIVLTPIFLCTLALVKRVNEIAIGHPDKDFVDKLLDQEELEKLFLGMST